MVNKRLSAVDVDLSLLEEDDDSFRSFDDSEDQRGSIVVVRAEERVSSPLIKQKRRSMSLNVGVGGGNSSPNVQHLPPPNASATELRQPSHSISEGFYHHPTTTSSSLATSHSNQPQTWTPNRMPPNRNQNLPAIPPNVNASFTYPTQRPLPNHPPPPPSFRQTAVSISSSFAPAAGLARKAVEKVKGALGHMGHHGGSNSGSISSASISSVSGYSSSASVSSGTPSHPNEFGVLNLSRSPSTRSSATHHTHSSSMHAVNIKEIKERSERERQQQAAASKKDKKMRRTPNGPSGTYSIASMSTTSGSDSDVFMSPGPILGVLLRGPMRDRSGAVASGIVFQRNLAYCVRDTAVWVGKEAGREFDGKELMERPELKVYERRMLPALVVRCAQHLLLWGVQEEGLFRVPGRAAHITKLRTEFDTGVDYDMSGCAPGDLDPHAVASTFKAFLRELPESILTHKLSPCFDAALEKEGSNTPAADPNTPHLGMRKGMGLPSSQKPMPSAMPSSTAFPAPNLRKPPSLSTFTVPTLSGTRPASRDLILALRSLIAQLPKENRDLLRTVIELVRATAKESKMTKMPLSNLLMVFLPTLNISATLFKVLCEEEGVWTGPVDGSEAAERELEPKVKDGEIQKDGEEVLDVRRDTVVLDIRRNSDDQQRQKDQGEVQASEVDDDDDDQGEDDDNPQRRWTVVNRQEIPTVYLDSRSRASSGSIASSGLVESSREASTTESSVLHDDVSYASVSTRSARGDDEEGMLSSSVESVLTPLTSSVQSSAAYLPLDALDTVKDLSSRDAEPLTATGPGPRILVVEPASPELEIGVEKEVDGKVRRIAVSNPLPYTSTPTPPPSSTTTSGFFADKSAPPESPISPTTATGAKRRSIPALSFPTLPGFGHRNSNSSVGSEPVSPAASLASFGKGQGQGGGLRTKKPSLKLLFKKSAGSLNNGQKDVVVQLRTASMVLAGGRLSAGASGEGSGSSDSSVSTPVSAVTAPGTAMSTRSGFELPPVLNASFEEGPSLRHELGLDESPPGTATLAQQQKDLKKKKERVKTMVGQTPIADWYSTKSAASSVSDLPLPQQEHHHVVEDEADYEEDYDVEAEKKNGDWEDEGKFGVVTGVVESFGFG
ncbi:hypothetical protein NP233_g11918 [Leucocoprinus birnbaumii]|uniref:Rho-GAP domain-containing protein n=1 Tax=Leucocoprinus birnbaumii TaxID=56174 RepID=A0AAD5VFX5_9AGAR|nr:hypothetical protein NP233_g11918 [Leucocoprinus birnbaumii]